MTNYKQLTKYTLYFILFGAIDAYNHCLYFFTTTLILGFITSIFYHNEINIIDLEIIRKIDIFTTISIIVGYVYYAIILYFHERLHILDIYNFYELSVFSLISGIMMYLISHKNNFEKLHGLMHFLFILAAFLFHRFYHIECNI